MADVIVDWRYTRQNCTTCERAQEFLTTHNVEAREVVDARRKTLGSREALELAASVDHIYARKGTKKVTFDLKKDKPSESELLAVMLGPTGNLRAPMIKRGRDLLVGFDPDNYVRVLSGK